MLSAKVVLVLFLANSVRGQRPFFAGSRPIGYPELVNKTTTTASLGDRFGEDSSTTTQRLPIEALGDKDLVDRLSKLPIDKQPFWFINWQALEANRQKPQTYPQRPSPFAQPIVPVQNSATGTERNPIFNPIRNVNPLATDSDLGNRFEGSNTEETSSVRSKKPNENNYEPVRTNLAPQKRNEQNLSSPLRDSNVAHGPNVANSNSDKLTSPLRGFSNPQPQEQSGNSATKNKNPSFSNANNYAAKTYPNSDVHNRNYEENKDSEPSVIFKHNHNIRAGEKPSNYGNKNIKTQNSDTPRTKPANAHSVLVDGSSDFGRDLFNLYRDESDYEGDFFDYLHAPMIHHQPLYESDFARSNKGSKL